MLAYCMLGFLLLIVVLFFVKIMVTIKRKTNNPSTSEMFGKIVIENNENNQNINCYEKTGKIDGENCICKHPDFLTNNFWNGNCDKIVDVNCKTIKDRITGLKMDFNKRDPYNYGVCDCGNHMVYDTLLRKCVLKRLGDNVKYKIKDAEKKCMPGHVYSKKYCTCIKDVCAWDMLNPAIRIDGGNCECDVTRGVLPIELAGHVSIAGCTKSIIIQNHIIEEPRVLLILFSHENNEEMELKTSVSLLYPQVGVGSYFRKVLNLEALKDEGKHFLRFKHNQNKRNVDKYLMDHNISTDIQYNNIQKFQPLDVVVFLNKILSNPYQEHILNVDSGQSKHHVLLKETEVMRRDNEMKTSSSRRFINYVVDISPLVIGENNNELNINPAAIRYNIFNSVFMLIYTQEKRVQYKSLLL